MIKRPTDWHEQLREEALSDPNARIEYEAFKLQLKVAKQLRNAREHVDLTQLSGAPVIQGHLILN